MKRHHFLARLHSQLAPRSYLEIGVYTGRGLALSRTRTIGVDPAFVIRSELACDLQLVRATSDDFFARPDAMSWFPDGVVDLAFIDGMHLFEYALRDFMNTERVCTPASVVVLDDMLPRSHAQAARERVTVAWAGDVYKVALVLEHYRPDLVVVPLDTTPTGLVLVAGLDPQNTVLHEHYDQIVAEYATPDPQHVPEAVLRREHAADPDAVLSSPVWSGLVAARSEGPAEAASRVDIASLRALRGTAQVAPGEVHDEPWPPPGRRPDPGPRSAAGPAAPVGGPRRLADRLRSAVRRGS